MTVADLAFYVFTLTAVAAGVLVTVSRNPVHSVLWLILAFLSAAGMFVLLGAEFVAMLLIIVSRSESVVLLALAWAFVALRYLHSYIHCTYNRVKHRFSAYLFSGLALWALWGMLAFSWLR